MTSGRTNPIRFSQWAPLGVIIFYALVHLPFLGIGFGEADAWRNGLSGLGIGQGQGYSPNRFPGFPVVELAFGGVAKLFPPEKLWIYTNTLTLIISLIGMIFYYKILTFHQISSPWITLLWLYGIPVIFINAASSMDNLWTMTFLLIGYWALWKGSPVLGSAFLALSIGCRISSAIFLMPFCLFLFANPGIYTRKMAIKGSLWLLSGVLLTLLSYLYINWMIYPGFYYFQQLSIPRDYLRSGYYLLQEIFGLPGLLFLLFCFLLKRKALPPWNWESLLLIITTVLFLVLFIYRPEKPSYWIPVLPFLGIWISRWLKGVSLFVLTGLIILNNMISFMVIQPSPDGLTLKWLDKGITWEKTNRHQEYKQDADFLIHYSYPPDSDVAIGWYAAGVEYLLSLPRYEKRKMELNRDHIIFWGSISKNKKKNTFWVSGSGYYKTERQFLSAENIQVISPPSSRSNP